MWCCSLASVFLALMCSCGTQRQTSGQIHSATHFHCWMLRCPLALFGVLLASGSSAAATAAAAAPANFLLVSGVTAADETCLVGAGASVWLDSCESAVTSLSGKEIWSLATDGSLVHTASKKCLSARGQTNADTPVELVPCDAAGGVPKWELQANGQIKMAQSNMCVSHLGGSNSVVNAAAAASASASSTLDPHHGAALAIDGVASTYWVSKMGEAGDVALLLDFGEPLRGSALDIDFEFVPSGFAVHVAGARPGEWLQVFATDANVLKHVKIPLDAAKPTSAVKLVMQTAHPTLGVLGGHKLFGVRSIKVLTRLLQPVLAPCAAAAKSPDARDKFFAVAVNAFDPKASATLAAELPALESADAALSAVVVELAGALPAMSSCKPAGSVLLQANGTMAKTRQTRQARRSGLDLVLDVTQETALLQEARATVIAARGLLV